MILPWLFINETQKKGRGVYTREAISEGSIIEIAPVIVLPEEEREWIDKSVLYNYYFLWGEDNAQTAIALGYGSMYNHSTTPNVAYQMDYEANTITYIAWIDIAAGEELCINYNGDEDSQEKVWFEL
jgi:SET domain-containing protein